MGIAGAFAQAVPRGAPRPPTSTFVPHLAFDPDPSRRPRRRFGQDPRLARPCLAMGLRPRTRGDLHYAGAPRPLLPKKLVRPGLPRRAQSGRHPESELRPVAREPLPAPGQRDRARSRYTRRATATRLPTGFGGCPSRGQSTLERQGAGFEHPLPDSWETKHSNALVPMGPHPHGLRFHRPLWGRAPSGRAGLPRYSTAC